MKMKSKIIVILGATATGKSDFAVELARKIGGEVISADSRQVYTGMNLGTGKITKKEMGGIPHHLIDVVSPRTVFSVHDFKKKAEKKIKEIVSRGKVPIICGGTGFYIETVISNNPLPEVPPHKALRQELATKSPAELFSYLKKLDHKRAETIDPHNPVRLIRAIEIAKALGKVPHISHESNYDVLSIGLALPDEILKEKIHTRLLSRIKKGMVKEIEMLHKNGIAWKRMHDLGLEYRYGSLYAQKKLSKEEMIEKLSTEIWHYAKRQKTWFKRNKNTVWIDPREITERSDIIRKTQKFLNKA